MDKLKAEKEEKNRLSAQIPESETHMEAGESGKEANHIRVASNGVPTKLPELKQKWESLLGQDTRTELSRWLKTKKDVSPIETLQEMESRLENQNRRVSGTHWRTDFHGKHVRKGS